MLAGAAWCPLLLAYPFRAAAVSKSARPRPSAAGKLQLLTGGSRRVELLAKIDHKATQPPTGVNKPTRLPHLKPGK